MKRRAPELEDALGVRRRTDRAPRQPCHLGHRLRRRGNRPAPRIDRNHAAGCVEAHDQVAEVPVELVAVDDQDRIPVAVGSAHGVLTERPVTAGAAGSKGPVRLRVGP